MYLIPIFWVFAMTQSRIELRGQGPLVNTVPTRTIGGGKE